MAARKEPRRRFGSTFGADLVAGATVAVVALPLALGFGITSGAGAASGLVTAIVAGFIAAVAGSSRFQVSGPTGAMTVILVPIVASLGVGALLPLGLMSGLIVIAFGLLRLGWFIEKVPWSVMEGFTLGIALVIAWQQVELIAPYAPATVALVIATLGIKLLWSRYRGRSRWTRGIPASAVAVVLVTATSVVARLETPTIGALPASDIFTFPSEFPAFDLGALVGPALSIALLAAVESLLAARVADSLGHTAHPDERPTHSPNRELVGQGLASLGSALFGGMPATGAIARTAVNVHAGAQTKWAAAFHALFLVVLVFALAPLVSAIPIAALAGVLLGTSIRIANPSSIRENLRTTWPNVLAFIVTAAAVFTIDLIWGIVIGMAVYAIGTTIRTRAQATTR